MKPSVLHITTSLTGGAGIAARRLHDAQRAAGVASRMAVARGGTRDGDILNLTAEKRGAGVKERLVARGLKLERRLSSRAVSRRLAFFSDDRVPGPDRLGSRPEADVINLHWVANLLDYRSFFRSLRERQPLVWTLHDMAPMTGGCHYAMDCERFTESCGACPLLGSPAKRDLTRRIHRRKAAALAMLEPRTTRVVAPSHWLAEEAARSSLLKRFQIDVVPNGLDTNMFRPRDKGLAREMLGLPRHGKILLFVAASVTDYRKGFDLLQRALSGLKAEMIVTLAALGGYGSADIEGAVPLGRIENDRVLSYVYSAADLFVAPTRADNLPNVLVEAMACGTPCVSFDVGGVPDVVRPDETGLLAPAEDVQGLQLAMERLISDDALRRRFGARGREMVETEFAEQRVAERYLALYEELLAAARAMAYPNTVI